MEDFTWEIKMANYNNIFQKKILNEVTDKNHLIF